MVHADNSVTVSDNGRGIPVELHPTEGVSAAQLVMTKLHAGGKVRSQQLQGLAGLHGVGVSAVNAVSEVLLLEIRRAGRLRWKQEYRKGAPMAQIADAGPSDGTGTTVTFEGRPRGLPHCPRIQLRHPVEPPARAGVLEPWAYLTLHDERGEGRQESFHFKAAFATSLSCSTRTRLVSTSRWCR